MGQFGKGNGDQHDLPTDNVSHEPEWVTRDLVTGKKTGHEGCNGDDQKEVVIGRCENPDFRKCNSPKDQKNSTDNHGNCQKVGNGTGDGEPADSPSFFQDDIMGQQKDRRNNQANVKDEKEYGHAWF